MFRGNDQFAVPSRQQQAASASCASRRVWHCMRALGKASLPATILLRGESYRLISEVKHDFFAATGFYDNAAGRRVVLKINRTVDLGAIPMQWIGRYLCGRETRFYRALSDVPNVPALLGLVGETGYVHEYVAGRPLERNLRLPIDFFDNLEALLTEIHRRDMAYVDTNKMSNILLGDDGLPHLIDFQISYDLAELGCSSANRWLLRRMQAADCYHALKHKLRLCPGRATAAERQHYERRHWLIRAHRALANPYKKFRRTTLRRLEATGRLLPTGSE
jgi:hypothetical protein